MSLTWREQLSVGNDLIDTGHQYLIDPINIAERNLQAKNWLELKTSFEQPTKYSNAHFVTEEKIAAAECYPQADRLHHSHAQLLTKLEKLAQDVSESWSQASTDAFINLLRDWLTNHVIKEDMLMRPYLKKYSPRFAPR